MNLNRDSEDNQTENTMLIGTSKTLLVMFTTTLFIWLVKFYWNRRNLYRLSAIIPGPRGYPFIGSALDFLEPSMEKTLQIIMKYYETYPTFFKFWMGPELVIGINKPEHLQIIMNHSQVFEKSKLYEVTKCLVGNGLFSAPVHIWKKNRKLISPAFNRKTLYSFVKTFSQKAINLTEIMRQNAGKEHLDIFSLISACNIDILCETAMGIVTNAQTSDDHFGKWIGLAEEIFILRMTNPWYNTNFIFRWTKKSKILDKLVTSMKDFTNQLITKRKNIFDKKISDLSNGILVDEGNNGQKLLLDVLIQMKDEMRLSEEELHDEVNTFFAAGPDTTTCALSFCFLMLGMLPDIQQKVYEEVIDVLGSDRDITAEDLPRLMYLERFIKETLRIFPTAPILTRSPSANIDIGDAVLPANCIIFISPLFTHRNPNYWNNPLTFDPDRFLPEEVSKRHPYSFLPFSAGPRGCIDMYIDQCSWHGMAVGLNGQACNVGKVILGLAKILRKGYKFAYMAMKSILATAVRKLVVKTEYKSIEEVKLQLSFLLKPCQGFKVSLKIRE